MGQMGQNNSHRNDVCKERGKLGTNNVVWKRCLKSMAQMEKNNSHKNYLCKQCSKFGKNNGHRNSIFFYVNGVVSGAKIMALETVYVSNVASWAKTATETLFGNYVANGAN